GVHLRILVDRAVHVEFLPHGLLLHLELGQPIVDAEESTVNAVHGTLPMIWHRWAGDTMAHRAGVAELADARHSKCRAHVACGFESRLRHPHPTPLSPSGRRTPNLFGRAAGAKNAGILGPVGRCQSSPDWRIWQMMVCRAAVLYAPRRNGHLPSILCRIPPLPHSLAQDDGFNGVTVVQSPCSTGPDPTSRR